MLAPVVIVHDHPTFLKEATSALRASGHDVVAFSDPFIALEAIEAAKKIEVLITRVTFPSGKPNGVSLALMARTRRSGLKIVFTAQAGHKKHTDGIGELLPHPIDMSKLVETVARLARSLDNGSADSVHLNLRVWEIDVSPVNSSRLR